MPAEGMVHALERACDITAADGRIIDLHPTRSAAHLRAVCADGGTRALGTLHADDARDRHARADAALADATARGLFAIERQATFMFCRESEAIDELIAFVSGKWNGRFDDETIARARAETSRGLVLSLQEEVAIGVYAPLRRRSRRS